MARILVVDDRPLNRDYLVTLLRYEEHVVVEATDGADALHQAESDPPDLIITDIIMPGVDGYDLAARIRRHPTLAATPMMFYTATYRAEEARALASTVGVSKVLRKPSEPEEILEAVRGLLRIQGSTANGAPVALSDVPTYSRHVDPAAAVQAGGTRARLTSLVEVLLDLSSRAERADILDLACRGARALLQSDWAWLGLRGSEPDTFRYLSSSGPSSPQLDSGVLDPGRGLVASVLNERRPARVSGVPGDPVALGLPTGAFPLRAAMGVPLIGRDGVIGCLFAANPAAEWFSDEDQSVAETIAAMTASAYENAALRDEAERNAARVAAEVTGRRRAEGKHRASESRYRALFERNLAAVFRGSLNGQVLECNEACAELLGFATGEEELARVHLEHALRAMNGNSIHDAIHREEGGINTELLLTRRDGAPVDVLARLSAVPGGLEGVAVVQGVMLDVTERKRREERVRASRAMEAIRRLCAGAAKEMDALTARVAALADEAAARPGRKDPAKKLWKEVLAVVDRVTGLTRLFKSLGERQPVAPRSVALDPLLSDLERQLRRVAAPGVEISMLRGPHTASLRADPWHIEQILLHVARNANEAMVKGGKLTIRVEEVDVDAADAMKWNLPQSGPHLLLAVSDTGYGMDPETRARVFEPFFSTKGRDRGLGLTTAYALVERSGGGIEIESQPGQGTTVRVLLPEAEVAKPHSVAANGPSRSSGLNPWPRRRTILAVEDDPSVRGLVKEFLETAGHSVLIASNGLDAIRVARGHPGPIDLVLTDVIMPAMNGADLVDRLTATRPDLGVLYMTGHREDAIAYQGVLEPGVSLIPKPFSRIELLARVEAMLRAKQGAMEVNHDGREADGLG
jgi:PAS domain S-box-containing protein